jgi:hypothetical protein
MVLTATGERFWGRLTRPPLATDGSATASCARVVMQIEDITSRREAELELADRALNDSLTGASNRFFTQQWLASALEDHPGGGVGVLYCDLDRFKVVNDSLGPRGRRRPARAGGRPAAQRDAARGPARAGSAATSSSSSWRASRRRPSSRRSPSGSSTPWRRRSTSVATSTPSPSAWAAPSARTRTARTRCSCAPTWRCCGPSGLGRARFVAFDPAQDRIATREDLQLEDELRLSLDAGQLRAYYQPIVALDGLAVVGHEALVRWAHPEHGLLPPARFLELAENSGLIRPLGWWMLEQACADAVAGIAGPTTASGWPSTPPPASSCARGGAPTSSGR